MDLGMQLGILFIFIIVDIKIITSWASSIPCQSAVFTRNMWNYLYTLVGNGLRKNEKKENIYTLNRTSEA